MTLSQWLLFVTCALSLYGVGQVWLVQLSSYRLWTFVGRSEFRAYHLAWWRSIWMVVLLPAVLVSIAAVLMLWWRPPGVPFLLIGLAVALQAALVLGTIFWWAPLMARIESSNGGLSPERFRLLIRTHWLRVAIVTAYGLLVMWMLACTVWSRVGP